MKVIFIMADSFRRDHVGAYGNKWIHTPNLDSLAGVSDVFDSMYVGSFPTGPNRRDILLGQGVKPGHAFNPWIQIQPKEITFPQRLKSKGVHSMMITDVQNGVTGGRNMFKGFDSYICNRGQEGDNCWSDDATPLEFPIPHEVIRYRAEHYHRVLMNRSHRRVEDDWFAPGTYKMACQWLERNWKRDNFLLWIETFDPHEPWDPPQYYIDRYDPGYKGRVIDCPPYGFYKRIGMTDREMRHTHARYAAECTMVDHSVGRLLATLEKLQLLDDVAIVFTSDHGICAGLEGDAGCVCKPYYVGEEGAWLIEGQKPKGKITHFPLRTGTMRIPLFVKMPRQKKGRRIGRIAQPWDLTPTVMELFGAKPPAEFQGESLLPVIAGKKVKPRPYAFNGAQSESPLRQAINRNWLYARWSGKGAREPWLIDLKSNPKQDKNVAKKHPEICRRMQAALRKWDPGTFEQDSGDQGE
jgi:arylsulfatase A-like enzyme